MSDRLFPLSYPQRMFWFLDKLEPDTPAYNLPRAFRMEGQLDVDALQEAFRVLIRRHEVLRTCFAELDGELYQSVNDDVSIELVSRDLSRLPASKREIEALVIASEEARKPFDLERPPLFRLKLVRLSPAKHVLILVMHHIITDGWSMSTLYREIARYYGQLVVGQQPQPTKFRYSTPISLTGSRRPSRRKCCKVMSNIGESNFASLRRYCNCRATARVRAFRATTDRSPALPSTRRSPAGSSRCAPARGSRSSWDYLLCSRPCSSDTPERTTFLLDPL